jgi:ABC-type multidrug transport system permease subunit
LGSFILDSDTIQLVFKVELGQSFSWLSIKLLVLLFLSIGVVMPIVNAFPDARAIIKRERSSGSYRASSAFIAKAITAIPLSMAGLLLMAIPIYWMIGFSVS